MENDYDKGCSLTTLITDEENNGLLNRYQSI